jgi:hypothetical protein
MQIEKREYEDGIDYGYFKGDVFIRHREDGPFATASDRRCGWK